MQHRLLIFLSLVTEQLGKPPKPITAKPGDVFFGGHATTPLTHRVSNFSDEQHHVLDIELIDSAASSNMALAALPARHIPILDNARVRTDQRRNQVTDRARWPNSRRRPWT